MSYQSILQRIEDEKKDEVISAKLYRYSGLVKAIDFFSQKLVFEQIIDAAFDFINELLLVERSAIYVIEDEYYTAKKIKGFASGMERISSTGRLRNLAALNGNILYGGEKIIEFFDPEILDTLQINCVVPLIIDGNLFGFVVFQSKNIGEDDYIISEALMRLINNALENFSRYEKLEKVNSELDQKIYNLFAINQSSKMLLSELRIEDLYNISVDVFSELTRSKITGFVLYDEMTDRYQLKAFKDVFYTIGNAGISLGLNSSADVDPNKVIVDLKNETDCRYIESLFSDAGMQLSQLESRYVVLLVKDRRILGFVTLSETVTGSQYSNGIFELIESLASSTYISLTNARLFKTVNDQKAMFQKKLDKLISLNNLTKNISSSIRVDTLMEMCAKALQISFNVEKGAFCLYQKETNEFLIEKTINLEHCKNSVISPNQNWKHIFEGDSVYALGQDNLDQYIGGEMAEKVGDAQGVLIIPVYVDMMDIEVLGALVVFKYQDTQLDDEENMLILETIAGNIAPVMNSLLMIQLQQRFILPNYIELFKNDLKQEIGDAKDYDVDLTVLQVKDEREFIFKGNSVIDSLKGSFKKVYPFSYNNIFIIDNGNDLEDRIRSCTNEKELVIKKMRLGSDFNSFAEFFDLYRY